MDHDHAVLGHALAGEPCQPRGDVGASVELARVEAQLRRGRELVDVLPARAGGANEADLDVVLVDGRSREIRSMASPEIKGLSMYEHAHILRDARERARCAGVRAMALIPG